MGKSSDRFWESTVFQRTLSRWAYAARAAQTEQIGDLRRRSMRAHQLRTHLDELISIADSRLAEPEEQSGLAVAHNCDWAWRPPLWQSLRSKCGKTTVESEDPLDEGATLFHDCPLREITFRQLRGHQGVSRGPYAIKLDILHFEGSFLSLALDIPEACTSGLSRGHILKMDIPIECERDIEVFVRLNIAHGPNTERLVRELDKANPQMYVEFDLATAELNEKRIEKCWIDVIFENPRMNQVILNDVIVSRRPRAQV